MEYEIILDPKDFGDRQDALFHYKESYDLADGDGWLCRLENCGEQYMCTSDHKLYHEEVLDKYNTDDKLNKAIDKGKIILVNNSWWEIAFYKVEKNSYWLLDLFGDNSEVVDSPQGAIDYFEKLMSSKRFVKDLKKALKEAGHD